VVAKGEQRMFKRILCVICFLLFVSVSGCATIEGAGKGLVKDTEGISRAVWAGVQKTDVWIKENLW